MKTQALIRFRSGVDICDRRVLGTNPCPLDNLLRAAAKRPTQAKALGSLVASVHSGPAVRSCSCLMHLQSCPPASGEEFFRAHLAVAMHDAHRAKPAPIDHDFSLLAEISALGDHGNDSIRRRISFKDNASP